MKGRAFYQKLERTLVHQLVVDRPTVDRLLLVKRDDRLVLDHVDLLLVQWWLVFQLIGKAAEG